MVFQPLSPIRPFHVPRPVPGQSRSQVQHPMSDQKMPERTSSTLEKLRLRRPMSKRASKALAQNDADMSRDSLGDRGSEAQISDAVSATKDSTSTGTGPLIQSQLKEKTLSVASTPTDPAYIPNSSGMGGKLTTLYKSAESQPSTPTRRVNRPQTESFFDSDSDSGEDDAVVGRASSVRISKPTIVQPSPTIHGKSAQLHSSSLIASERAVSPLDPRISEGSEATNSDHEPGSEDGSQGGGPKSALKHLEGKTTHRLPERASMPAPTVVALAAALGGQGDAASKGGNTDRSKRDGLHLNPVTKADHSNIQRAVSAPPIPQKRRSNKKVKIRPADLIIGHSRDSARMFRESVVTTPYPTLNDDDEKTAKEERANEEKVAELPRRSNTVKSARFEDDRFPSPDRAEVLFLDLGLAGHPSATTTLEIKIANKSVYDDEMLFRQIRTAYRSRLLGLKRLPFCMVRGVAHATVSPLVEYDFRTTEFMKHFNDPRIGRKRKTWVIWLRIHSKQETPVRTDHLSITKRPLSASLRTADRRLSTHSDSTSTFNFPFMPPLSIPRLPFFNREPATPSSATTYRSPPAFGSEGGVGTVKVELHHEFSFWVLAFLYFWVLFFSIAAVVFWVFFGVPGARPGDDQPVSVAVIGDGLTWSVAAQSRVLTGLVLGMMVALIGSMIEFCLISGAYILL